MNKMKRQFGMKPRPSPLRDGLVLDLPMLGVGDLHDYSENGNIVTPNGPTWTNSEMGTALEFDGSSRMTLPSASRFATVPFTMAGQIYPTSTGFKAIIHNNGNQSWSNGAGFFVNGAACRFVLAGTSVPNSGDVGTAITINTWNSWAVTYDNVTAYIYINGEEIYAAPTTGAIDNQNKSGLTIGDTGFSQYRFVGKMSQCLYYDRALSAQEIKSLYDNPWQAWQKDNIALWAAAQGGTPPTGGKPYYYYQRMRA